VKNLKTHDKGRTFKRITGELEQLGYNVVSNVFNTSDFHLPQTRNRVLIFATTEQLPDKFQALFNSSNVATMFEKECKNLAPLIYNNVLDILKPNVAQKYYLSERIKPTILADGSANFKSKSEINLMIARPLTASMHKMHRACQDNYYSDDFITSHGETNSADVMSKEELAQIPIRRLTPEEAFLLQGFPANFASDSRIAGVSDGALYKQAGNAVSVNTIYAVLYFLIKNNVIK
jgi:DNA (cytosine-5)-methyltransferase 1